MPCEPRQTTTGDGDGTYTVVANKEGVPLNGDRLQRGRGSASQGNSRRRRQANKLCVHVSKQTIGGLNEGRDGREIGPVYFFLFFSFFFFFPFFSSPSSVAENYDGRETKAQKNEGMAGRWWVGARREEIVRGGRREEGKLRKGEGRKGRKGGKRKKENGKWKIENRKKAERGTKSAINGGGGQMRRETRRSGSPFLRIAAGATRIPAATKLLKGRGRDSTRPKRTRRDPQTKTPIISTISVSPSDLTVSPHRLTSLASCLRLRYSYNVVSWHFLAN